MCVLACVRLAKEQCAHLYRIGAVDAEADCCSCMHGHRAPADTFICVVSQAFRATANERSILAMHDLVGDGCAAAIM